MTSKFYHIYELNLSHKNEFSLHNILSVNKILNTHIYVFLNSTNGKLVNYNECKRM